MGRDDPAELLNAVGLDNVYWDCFAFLLGLVGIHRLLEGRDVVRENDAVEQCRCEVFAVGAGLR